MKLPGREIGGVQDRSSVDPSVYKQAGEAVGGAFDVGSELAGKMAEHTAEVANRDAILEVTNQNAQTVEQYGHQRSFSYDDITAMKMDLPKDITHREIAGSDGKSRSVPRTEIPAEDVWPHYMKRQGELQIEIQAKTIPGSARRKEFEQRQGALLVEQYGRELVKGHDARERKQITKFERDIANAETAGNFDVAMTLVRQHPILSEEEKDLEIIRLLQEQETRHLFNTANDGTDAMIQQEIDRLESDDYGQDKDGDFHNSFTQAQRKQEIRALNGVLSARATDRKKQVSNDKAAVYSGTVDLILDPTKSFEEGALAINAGVAGGYITASQSDALKDLQRNQGKIDPERDKTHVLEELAKDPAKFSEVDLREFRGYVDEGTLETYRKRQKTLQEDRGRATTQENLRGSALMGLGVDTRNTKLLKDDNALAQMRLLDVTAQALMDNYQTKNGVPPAGRDLQNLYREAAQVVRVMRPEDGKQEKIKGSNWFIKQTLSKHGVSDDFIANTIASFTEQGRADEITPEFVFEQWEKFQSR